MRFALVNPNWSFEGSIYFGCREPHLPLEFGYSKALLEAAGHEALIVDGQIGSLDTDDIRNQLAAFCPDYTVVTTAPSYLFWRCAPPELTVPKLLLNEIRDLAGKVVVVGPHASTTPRATLRKLDAGIVVMGECEEILPQITNLHQATSVCFRDGDEIRIKGGTHSSDMNALPSLAWPDHVIRAHAHHHHRFDKPFEGFGAEMEASRGCPYHCTFCAKDNFRDRYRRRPIERIMQELERLLDQGVTYIYFIDEIFLPNRELLQALAIRSRDRKLRIGVQTRIDLWNFEMIDLLADAGCVSIEAGIESLTPEGRELLDKKCRMDTDELSRRLIYAKNRVAFVQANLIKTGFDDPETVGEWRERMRAAGVWANDPVPMFPYPGSPDYTLRWGAPDDLAWERAHAHYLSNFTEFSELQDVRPVPLVQLERA
jgi:B12-binding domain/radical SAM domain protein of rhizo-twelve system